MYALFEVHACSSMFAKLLNIADLQLLWAMIYKHPLIHIRSNTLSASLLHANVPFA